MPSVRDVVNNIEKTNDNQLEPSTYRSPKNSRSGSELTATGDAPLSPSGRPASGAAVGGGSEGVQLSARAKRLSGLDRGTAAPSSDPASPYSSVQKVGADPDSLLPFAASPSAVSRTRRLRRERLAQPSPVKDGMEEGEREDGEVSAVSSSPNTKRLTVTAGVGRREPSPAHSADSREDESTAGDSAASVATPDQGGGGIFFMAAAAKYRALWGGAEGPLPVGDGRVNMGRGIVGGGNRTRRDRDILSHNRRGINRIRRDRGSLSFNSKNSRSFKYCWDREGARQRALPIQQPTLERAPLWLLL